MENLFKLLAALGVGYSIAEMLLPEGKIRKTARFIVAMIISCIMVTGFFDMMEGFRANIFAQGRDVINENGSTYEERNDSVLGGLKELAETKLDGGEESEADR